MPLALLSAIGLGVLAGRPSPAVVALNDGHETQAVDTPPYNGDSGFCEFEQLDDRRTRMNKSQVRTVKEF